MRRKIALGLFALAWVGGQRTADASAILFTFAEDGRELAFAADGTVHLNDKTTGRACDYALAPQDKTLLADFRGADVQSALRANAVVPGNAARLVAGTHTIDWAPSAHAPATYALRLFNLELRVQMLKARSYCAGRP